MLIGQGAGSYGRSSYSVDQEVIRTRLIHVS